MPSARERLDQLRAELGALDRERAAIVAQIEALERVAAEEELTERNQRGTQSGNMPMPSIERKKHSKERRGMTARTRKLREAALASGLTVRDLAAAVKTTHTQLSLAANGERPISPDMAKQIEKLTGHAATVANWPKLRTV